MTNDELLSKTIKLLRFPLCAGVPFAHFNLSQGIWIHGEHLGTDNPQWYYIFIQLASEILPSIIVPCFFLFSGYLFFYHKDFNSGVYKQALKKRARTLLLPFLLWNFIAILWELKCFVPGISAFFRPMQVEFTPIRLLNTLFCNLPNTGIFIYPDSTSAATEVFPIDTPLWYIRELMIMVILTPIIYWVVKKCKGWGLAVLGILWGVSNLFKDNPLGLYLGFFFTGAFFFSCGAFFSINKKNFVTEFGKFRHAIVLYVVLIIIDILTLKMDYNWPIHKVEILVGVVAVITVAAQLAQWGKVKIGDTLSGSSFFIYAFHCIFISDLGKIAFSLLHVPHDNPWAMLALYLAVPILSILICLATYIVLKRYVPMACKLLTGGR